MQVKRARKEGASSEARPAAAPVKGSFVEDSDSDAEPAPVTGRFGRRRLNMAAGWSCIYLLYTPYTCGSLALLQCRWIVW